MTRAIGIALIVLGMLIVVFSERIVFPYLEELIGIENIVGKANVVYDNPNDHDSAYVFTNPVAMMRWVAGVALCGFLLMLSGIAIIFKEKAGSILRKLLYKT